MKYNDPISHFVRKLKRNRKVFSTGGKGIVMTNAKGVILKIIIFSSIVHFIFDKYNFILDILWTQSFLSSLSLSPLSLSLSLCIYIYVGGIYIYIRGVIKISGLEMYSSIKKGKKIMKIHTSYIVD